ncbi:MAG: HNH endonuclease [Verrucomicrobiota bacterium]|nr:HNH endonuclease [Verrucomicrobiota bacterium]
MACEYCHAPEEVTGYAFHIEHIHPRVKDGVNEIENYALSCMPCNRAKSYHITGKDLKSGKEERLFNPRQDKWADHFKIRDKLYVCGKTAIGRATENRLQLNQPRQLEARKLWKEIKLFP